MSKLSPSNWKDQVIRQDEIDEIQEYPFFQKIKDLMDTFWKEYNDLPTGERDVYL